MKFLPLFRLFRQLCDSRINHSSINKEINTLLSNSAPFSSGKKKRRQNARMAIHPTELSEEARALLRDLEQKINYSFSNSELLIEALTHSSVALDQTNNPFDNERLEFLGDAVLQLAITEHLFQIFPNFEEGPLTKIRTRLVSRTALKAYASHLELGKYLIMGRGEETSGGRERSSILGDSFEALIGAIYLDGGLLAARDFILREAKEHLQNVMIEPEEINPKGRLQEILQSKAPSPPLYEHLEERGEAHLKHFRCRVLWEGRELGSGEGRSKKEAEVAAATQALKSFPS